MTTLPAVVTIEDLPSATTLSGTELFEAVQTSGSTPISVQVPLSAIATYVISNASAAFTAGAGIAISGSTTITIAVATAGIGSTQLGTFAVQTQNITAGAVGSTQLSAFAVESGNIATGAVGSTQLGSFAVVSSAIATNAVGNIQLRQGAPLSVIGVAGNATANVADIIANATAGDYLQVNAGGTGLVFGPLLTSSLPGPFQVSTFTTFGVVYGNGTSALVATAPGTTGWPLVGSGTAAAPSFAVLTVPGGGTGTTTLTSLGLLYGNGTATVGALSAMTDAQFIVGRTSTTPALVAFSGDITVSTAGTATIGTAVVSYAKIQNSAATAIVLGRKSATVGPPEELTSSDLGSTMGVLLKVGNQTVTGGFSVTGFTCGTISSGTFTVSPASSNYQLLTVGGAFTFAAPSLPCAVDFLFTNNSSAGAVTFLGFTASTTNAGVLATTNGNQYLVSVRRIGATSTYAIYGLQT